MGRPPKKFSDELAELSGEKHTTTPTDWTEVEEIFLHPGRYVYQLVKEILEGIQEEKKLAVWSKVSVATGPVPGNELHPEIYHAIEYVKMSFLKRLEEKGVIKNLKERVIEFEDEPDSSPIEYVAANFEYIHRNLVAHLNSSLEKLEGKKVAADGDEILSDFKFEGGLIKWRGQGFPARKGYERMLEIFLQDASVYSDGKQLKPGNPISRQELQNHGGYRDETSFRDALKKLKKKLGIYAFPATIENVKQNHYMLVIRY